ncbi:cupin domain-containing protein [Desulfitobacterium sp.]|uniref:cupin domain-containing protein n=1 Tax=Desulfitobacterium sp. TaxID=49981 RepID=UPI002C8809D5|nr:cupin domain-containing protein [Desulfitobacterium sp.]HVJ48790.1 cupin domain-containing protein [Desulfitobacterium sp.]
MLIRHLGNYDWENTLVLNYKEEGTHFKSITRRVLCEGLADVPCQLRYFEIAPEGYSTLEHHQHAHLVMIFRGEGEVLLGDKIYPVQEKDVVTIPAQTWHQFRATKGTTFGFLCLVNIDRDRPFLPTEDDLKLLRQNPEIAAFIRS